MMHILITDLHEHAPALAQQLPGQQQPIPQIGEIRMNAQLPGIPEGPDLLRLAGEVLVLAILHVPLIHKGLEIAAVAYAIGRIDIDHLHPSGHALLLQK